MAAAPATREQPNGGGGNEQCAVIRIVVSGCDGAPVRVCTQHNTVTHGHMRRAVSVSATRVRHDPVPLSRLARSEEKYSWLKCSVQCRDTMRALMCLPQHNFSRIVRRRTMIVTDITKAIDEGGSSHLKARPREYGQR